jgi:hypothetical protein
MDLSPLWNGQPTTLDFYSGGINGTLVYSETESDPIISLGLPTLELSSGTWVWSQDGDLPGDTIDQKWKPALDAAITTPGGTVLPADDAIDLIDFGATSSAPVQFSSDAITAGGGIGSFEIIGEQVIVPEPSSITLLGSALLGLGLVCLRRRRATGRGHSRRRVDGGQ